MSEVSALSEARKVEERGQTNVGGRRQQDRVKMIDFNQPHENRFLAVTQLWGRRWGVKSSCHSGFTPLSSRSVLLGWQHSATRITDFRQT